VVKQHYLRRENIQHTVPATPSWHRIASRGSGRIGDCGCENPNGAQFEFTLAAITQNLCRLDKLVARPLRTERDLTHGVSDRWRHRRTPGVAQTHRRTSYRP
jgi:hypothetical protein